jgi:glycosyltransferase involved in cell wall biosynthesis
VSVKKNKKIAIISGHFMPEIGYQETYLAKAYSRLGYSVRVFSSTAISPTGKNILNKDYAVGLSTEPQYGFEIERLPITVNLNSKIIANGLANKVKAYNPDYILIIALAKLFPLRVLTTSLPGIKKIALFGDAAEYTDRTSASKRFKAVFHEAVSLSLKRRLYALAVKHCDRIVLNIKETESFFKKLLSKPQLKVFDKKKMTSTLGYDPDSFFYDATEGGEIRKELNISTNDCIIITSTRVNKQKRLEEIIAAVSNLKESGCKVHYVIIGFLGDGYEIELKNFIASQKHPEIFHCIRFVDHHTIRKYYNASDIGLWLKAAISIQEAMGTGLKIVLENKEIVSHLLKDEINGWYYDKGKLSEALAKAVDSFNKLDPEKKNEERNKVIKMNADWLSYDVISQRIIEDL